jgi:hypothetical protein
LRERNPTNVSWTRCLLASLSLLVALVAASHAFAQAAADGVDGPGDIQDIPPGNASILGQLVHPGGNAKTLGATIVLYSLAADGSPGARTTEADASGEFAFLDLSNASGITYLVGASYKSIPYGKRVVFEPGQSELAVTIDVEDPVEDSSQISVGDSSLRLEWIGASLGVEEVHQLANPGSHVVFVSPENREGKRPAFRTTLPKGYSRLDTTLSGIAEGFEVNGDELIFWGPIYAGGLELRFRYLLPIDQTPTADMSLRWQLDSGSEQASLLFPPEGPTLSLDGRSRSADITLGERLFHTIDLGRANPGQSFDVAISLPEMSNDRSAIKIPRADFWLDADDTFMQVSVEINLVVAQGAHLTGSAEAPLLTLVMPTAAEFLGYSQESQNIGLMPLHDGNLAVIGPLSPGNSNVAFRYRLPVRNGKPEIDLHFPAAVDVINVLIADTGVAIETDRLHRRRPFRQGSRVYLHREAFAIEEGEVINIGLSLIDRASAGRNTYIFATSMLAALGAWFIVSPLVGGRRASAREFEQARIRSERELVYQAIRDLEHDFETAKIEDGEFQTMRGELVARGVTLLAQERDAKAGKPEPAVPNTSAAQDAFCTGCGSKLDAAWKFCASCGADTTGQAQVADP